jgi:hypothetical protein
MTSAELKNDQLSNTKNQDFKSELPNTKTQTGKTELMKTSDIVEFKLTLKNNTELSIPVSKDGYVNVTKLCKAGGKEYKHWKENKESEAVINGIERSIGIPIDLIIRDIRTGKNESRGTFVHRRLALIIAQWISPDFAVQVAAWTEELTLQLEEKNKVIETKEKETKQYQDSLTTKQQNKTNFEQSSDIIELKLVLQNNTEINIPVSKDGYVNCTKLCKAGGKRIDNWNRLKQSEELLQAYSKLPHNQGTEKAVPHKRGTEKAERYLTNEVPLFVG